MHSGIYFENVERRKFRINFAELDAEKLRLQIVRLEEARNAAYEPGTLTLKVCQHPQNFELMNTIQPGHTVIKGKFFDSKECEQCHVNVTALSITRAKNNLRDNEIDIFKCILCRAWICETCHGPNENQSSSQHKRSRR